MVDVRGNPGEVRERKRELELVRRLARARHGLRDAAKHGWRLVGNQRGTGARASVATRGRVEGSEKTVLPRKNGQKNGKIRDRKDFDHESVTSDFLNRAAFLGGDAPRRQPFDDAR